MAESASLQFGITIRAWSLIYAADAFLDTRDALLAIELLAFRSRHGTLRVYSGHDSSKSGIAAIPLELLLSFRDTIIDSALRDAEHRHLRAVEAAHNRSATRAAPFSHCLACARAGDLDALCAACRRPPDPQIDFQAIARLLAKHALVLVSSPSTPLLAAPPHAPVEPAPWVVALATHTIPTSAAQSSDISFFAPSFMRITSADIMRFRNLVRTWRLVLVTRPGPVTTRGAPNRSRSSSSDSLPSGALVDIALVPPSTAPCEPRWMLLHPSFVTSTSHIG